MNKKNKPKKNIKKEKINWEDVAKRAMADLDNYKKQQEKMRGEMTQFMSITLMHKFLSVYDDLNRVISMEDISNGKKYLLRLNSNNDISNLHVSDWIE